MQQIKTELSQIIQRPEFLLNQLSELVIIYNLDKTIAWMNDPAIQTLKIDSNGYKNKKCHDIWCISKSECLNCPINECLKKATTVELEKKYRDRLSFMVRGVPLKNESGKVIGAIGFVRDITWQKRNDEAILRSKDELKLLIENQNDLIIKLDNTFNYVYISESYKEHYGHSLDELSGKNIFRFVESQDIPYMRQALEILSVNNQFSYVEVRESTLNGLIWLGWSFKAIFNNHNELVSIVGVGRDITEKRHIENELKTKNKAYKKLNEELKLQNYNYEKLTTELVKRNNQIQDLYLQLKESEERFRTMFMKHSSIMYLIEPETREIINANEAAIRYYGFEQHEFLGMSLDKIIVPSKANNYRKQAYPTGNRNTPTQFQHKLKSGRIRDVEVYTMPIFIEREAFEFSIVYDITERNRAQKRLALSEKKLRKANQAKDKFFSIIAHDLKNPFNALIGLSEYLVSNFKKIDGKRVFDILTNINQVSNQTYALLEGLLQWARTQSGTMTVNITLLNLKEVIEQNIQLAAETARAKDIKIKYLVNGDTLAYGDHNMINTVVRNLLSNAIKYSYRGQTITISLETSGKHRLLSVIDEGKGMPAEIVNNLFSIESNLSMPGTEKEKGTGLGLIVCKEFIEKCKGKLWVESTPDAGSKFSFKLKIPEN